MSAGRARGLGASLPRGPLAAGAILLGAFVLGTAWLASGPATGASVGCPFTVSVTASPSSGNAPLLVHLNATVSAGTVSEFDWEFGDGSFWNATGTAAAAPIHRYSNPGTYPVNVTAVEAGCRSAGHVTVAAGPSTLAATVLATPSTGSAPLTVTFDLVVSGGTGTYVSALWSFGDGGVGSGFPVNYTFRSAGTFSVLANVTDSGGHWTVAHATVVVGASGAHSSGLPLGGTGLLEIAAAGAGAAVLVGLVVYRGARGSTLGPPPGAVDGGSPADSESAPALTSGSEIAAAPILESGIARSPREGSRGPSRPPPPTSDAARGARVQLTQRVVLHIGAQGRLAPDALGPAKLTQAGMAEALGVGQNSLTNVLRRLVAAGILAQDLRHVSGRPRRLRVYRLTDRGEALLRDLRAPPRTTSAVGGVEGTSPRPPRGP